jgi:hypothetical protein
MINTTRRAIIILATLFLVLSCFLSNAQSTAPRYPNRHKSLHGSVKVVLSFGRLVFWDSLNGSIQNGRFLDSFSKKFNNKIGLELAECILDTTKLDLVACSDSIRLCKGDVAIMLLTNLGFFVPTRISHFHNPMIYPCPYQLHFVELCSERRELIYSYYVGRFMAH